MEIVYRERSNKELRYFAKHVWHIQGNTENNILGDTGANIIPTSIAYTEYPFFPSTNIPALNYI